MGEDEASIGAGEGVLEMIAEPPLKEGVRKTAERAVQLLVSRGGGFKKPTPIQRRALGVGFALRDKVIYGKAFDLVRLSRPVDLSDPQAIASNLDAITIIEVKSTNRVLPEDMRTYFFALTTAELLVAQSLGDHYRFAFVNTTTGYVLELSMPEVFARARKIYPTWSILF